MGTMPTIKDIIAKNIKAKYRKQIYRDASKWISRHKNDLVVELTKVYGDVDNLKISSSSISSNDITIIRDHTVNLIQLKIKFPFTTTIDSENDSVNAIIIKSKTGKVFDVKSFSKFDLRKGENDIIVTYNFIG